MLTTQELLDKVEWLKGSLQNLVRDAERCLYDFDNAILELTEELPPVPPPRPEPVFSSAFLANEAMIGLSKHINTRCKQLDHDIQDSFLQLGEELYWDFQRAEAIRLKDPYAISPIRVMSDYRYEGSCDPEATYTPIMYPLRRFPVHLGGNGGSDNIQEHFFSKLQQHLKD